MSYDVVVVGARCAGAAVAMLLARAGLSVLAVDRARYGSDTLSTHALTRAAVLLLSRWGVLDQVRAVGTPAVTRVVYHYPDGEVADVPVKPRGDVDALYGPRRHVLDRILVDAAVRAGAEVRNHTSVADVTVEDGRVVGVVLDEQGARVPVRARIVIGADGARSVVARRVGADVRYAAPDSTATIYTYAAGLPQDAYRNYFRPGLAAGLIPTNAGQANVWVSMPMRRLRRARPGDRTRLFSETLTRAAPELATAVDMGRLATFTGMPGHLRRCWGPGWALVGDAGYFKDPISAHGMTDALIGAELVARAVAAIRAGEDERAALRRYARQRWQLIAPMLPAIAHLASFGWEAASLQDAHRAMNAAMRAEWDFLTTSSG